MRSFQYALFKLLLYACVIVWHIFLKSVIKHSINGKVEEGRAFGLGDALSGKAGGIGVVIVAIKVTLEHLDVCLSDGNETSAFDGNVEGPGAVVVIEVNDANLPDGVCAFIFFVRYGGILVVEVPPGHDVFIQDTITIVGLNLAEFYSFIPGHDSFSVFALEWQDKPVQRLWTRAIRMFAVEFGGALRGYLRSAVAKESPESPLGPLL